MVLRHFKGAAHSQQSSAAHRAEDHAKALSADPRNAAVAAGEKRSACREHGAVRESAVQVERMVQLESAVQVER